jgi:hypothetical protein
VRLCLQAGRELVLHICMVTQQEVRVCSICGTRHYCRDAVTSFTAATGGVYITETSSAAST